MPRLPRGMFTRGNIYYTRIHKGGGDRWVSLGPDKDIATNRLNEIQRDGLPISTRVTVGQAAVKWLRLYIATRRTPHDQRQAASRVGRYLEPFIGTKQLHRVTPNDMRQFRLWLESRPISPGTVRVILRDARCFFGWCLESGMIEKVPIPRGLLPRLQERPPDRISEEGAERAAALPEPFGFLVRLGLGTGLRWGEMCRAQRSDVSSGALVVHFTKSRKIRRVPLDPELRAEIMGRVGRLCAFHERSSGDFNRQVRKLSGIEGFHVHQLRHTFACRWVEKGGSLASLQQILGHASIVTTQRYARLSDEAVMREAEWLRSTNRSSDRSSENRANAV